MKILLFSALLAVAAADPIQEDTSGKGEIRKPGMCFEEYMKSHPGEFAKVKEKMVKSIEGKADDNGGKAPWHLMDFSKLSRCSADGECKDADKCCRTMCGMRCIKPVFEHQTIDEIRSQVPNFDAAGGDGELTPRQKRDTEEGSEKSSEDKDEDEAAEDQEDEEENSKDIAGEETEKDKGDGREKRSVDEEGSGEGKRGHGERSGGKGKGKGKCHKGKGSSKHHKEEEGSGKRRSKGMEHRMGGGHKRGKGGKHEHKE